MMDPRAAISRTKSLLPGVAVCATIAFAAQLLESLEHRLLGRSWVEALVLAILTGIVVRSVWSPTPTFQAGITFASKTLLEVAVVLLGASLSAVTVVAAGPALLIGIALVVSVAIVLSYGLGRAFGLPRRMAILVACGNSICGNSAIAAVAPVIGAKSEDVGASIAFTAVFGVVVVLGLPLLVPLLQISETQYGVLAGLTVYAVPQVLAATVPVGPLSVQMGTLVKLLRVLMLGPVVIGLSLMRRHSQGGGRQSGRPVAFVPWFIIGFLGVAALRAAGMLSQMGLDAAATLATALTVVSMAALGLSVDVRQVAAAGGKVTATVVLSLVALAAVSLGLIHVLGIS